MQKHTLNRLTNSITNKKKGEIHPNMSFNTIVHYFPKSPPYEKI